LKISRVNLFPKFDGNYNLDVQRDVKQCQPIQFVPSRAGENILKIEGFGDDVFVFTRTTVYKLSSEFHMLELNTPQQLSFNQIKMLKNRSLIYINDKNETWFASDLNFTYSRQIMQGSVISPKILESNGEFTIIRFEDYYSGHGYNIFNHSIPYHEYNQVKIYVNTSFHTGLTLNNTIIFLGDHSYMYYKTDLGGFIRSQIIESEGLMGNVYSDKVQNAEIQFRYDRPDSHLRKEVYMVNSLKMLCQPELNAARMINSHHAAKFITKPDDRDIQIAHEIMWLNEIQPLGWIIWGVFGFIGLVALYCIVSHLVNFKKDSALLEKLKKEQEELMVREIEEKEARRLNRISVGVASTFQRYTIGKSDEFTSEGESTENLELALRISGKTEQTEDLDPFRSTTERLSSLPVQFTLISGTDSHQIVDGYTAAV
jgi:hypothetical protein